ncbi:hypothetical protein H5410_023214 [Solanum commersonii]|uniref:Uncharacterized protein n=1 Tax=Solanum commersonii TaxID=4109 RepID=A0A9J5ZHM9_SOLCO|nr:hypothetical protein H5410_023214 [Solanum commersonii]
MRAISNDYGFADGSRTGFLQRSWVELVLDIAVMLLKNWAFGYESNWAGKLKDVGSLFGIADGS